MSPLTHILSPQCEMRLSSIANDEEGDRVDKNIKVITRQRGAASTSTLPSTFPLLERQGEKVD